MDEADDIQLEATRRSIHAVAEQVLAAALYQATGHIGLRVAPGGVATPPFGDGPEWCQLAILGTELVVLRPTRSTRSPVTTIAAAAAAAGIVPGLPADLYPPATHVDRDQPLAIDPVGAARLSVFMTTAWEALEQLRSELAPDSPSPLQLWPEHFDLATAISEVNYGASPGDDAHPLPYLYMGPWSPPAVDGDFWNEPFGASRTMSAPATTAEVLEFFREGRRHLGLPVTA